jgi:hypothetical protein
VRGALERGNVAMKYSRLGTIMLAIASAALLGGCGLVEAITGTPVPRCAPAWDTLRVDTLQGAPVIRPDRCEGTP